MPRPSHEQAVRQGLIASGLPPAAIAALLGRIRQESNFHPLGDQDPTEGGSHGLFNVGSGVWRDWVNYARANGLSVDYDAASQTEFMVSYFQRVAPDAYQRFISATDPQQAGDAWRSWNYGGNLQGKDDAYARAYARTLGNNQSNSALDMVGSSAGNVGPTFTENLFSNSFDASNSYSPPSDSWNAVTTGDSVFFNFDSPTGNVPSNFGLDSPDLNWSDDSAFFNWDSFDSSNSYSAPPDSSLTYHPYEASTNDLPTTTYEGDFPAGYTEFQPPNETDLPTTVYDEGPSFTEGLLGDTFDATNSYVPQNSGQTYNAPPRQTQQQNYRVGQIGVGADTGSNYYWNGQGWQQIQMSFPRPQMLPGEHYTDQSGQVAYIDPVTNQPVYNAQGYGQFPDQTESPLNLQSFSDNPDQGQTYGGSSNQNDRDREGNISQLLIPGHRLWRIDPATDALTQTGPIYNPPRGGPGGGPDQQQWAEEQYRLAYPNG